MVQKKQLLLDLRHEVFCQAKANLVRSMSKKKSTSTATSSGKKSTPGAPATRKKSTPAAISSGN
jgi:hypothetical protein